MLTKTNHARRKLALLVLIALALPPTPSSAQVYQELYAFAGGADGGVPEGALVQGSDGSFYGTTFYGGQISSNFTGGAGTVFKITPEGALTTLAAFDGTNNGQHPFGALVQATDGNFYGTSLDGTFKVTAGGILTARDRGGGEDLVGDLVQATNGYLYGAQDGNFPGIFWETLDNHSWGFVFTSGTPSGGLIQASDGNLYGTISSGGAGGYGTVYRMTPEGALTTMASFYQWVTNAVWPYDRLLQASDGNFYGVAGGGPAGRIFKMTPDGAVTTMASLNGGDQGHTPRGPLVEANDGNFYGVATYSGSGGYHYGTVFKMTPNGQLTPLFSFTGILEPYPGGTPYAGLIKGSDGNLYGTTGTEASAGNGNVFRIIMPGPQLNSFRAGQQLVLSWRTNYVGFKLQSSPALSGGNWSDCTNSLSTVGGQFFVTNSISSGAQFFRLKK